MNSESDLARGWLIKAASDLNAAQLVVDGDGPYDTACFHAQQAIEKSWQPWISRKRPTTAWLCATISTSGRGRTPQPMRWRQRSGCSA
jgi:hypothetical protein